VAFGYGSLTIATPSCVHVRWRTAKPPIRREKATLPRPDGLVERRHGEQAMLDLVETMLDIIADTLHRGVTLLLRAGGKARDCVSGERVAE
jgi:hypothetical protein